MSLRRVFTPSWPCQRNRDDEEAKTRRHVEQAPKSTCGPIASSSQGRPAGSVMRARRPKKNQYFLVDPAALRYCFSERRERIGSLFMAPRDRRSGIEASGRDSDMAPQAIEIAQNGLGNGNPRLCPPSANSAIAVAITGASAIHRP
jgi:hypothetical protein